MNKKESYTQEASNRIVVLGCIYGADWIDTQYQCQLERLHDAKGYSSKMSALKALVKALDKDIKQVLGIEAPADVTMGQMVIKLRHPDPEAHYMKEINKLWRSYQRTLAKECKCKL